LFSVLVCCHYYLPNILIRVCEGDVRDCFQVFNLIVCALQAEAQDRAGDSAPHIKATKVTTRTATSREDKEKNATTSEVL